MVLKHFPSFYADYWRIAWHPPPPSYSILIRVVLVQHRKYSGHTNTNIAILEIFKSKSATKPEAKCVSCNRKQDAFRVIESKPCFVKLEAKCVSWKRSADLNKFNPNPTFKQISNYKETLHQKFENKKQVFRYQCCTVWFGFLKIAEQKNH